MKFSGGKDSFWIMDYLTLKIVPKLMFIVPGNIYINYGKVFVFDSNDNGQLGLDDTRRRVTPNELPNIKTKAITCGGYHTILKLKLKLKK